MYSCDQKRFSGTGYSPSIWSFLCHYRSYLAPHSSIHLRCYVNLEISIVKLHVDTRRHTHDFPCFCTGWCVHKLSILLLLPRSGIVIVYELSSIRKDFMHLCSNPRFPTFSGWLYFRHCWWGFMRINRKVFSIVKIILPVPVYLVFSHWNIARNTGLVD